MNATDPQSDDIQHATSAPAAEPVSDPRDPRLADWQRLDIRLLLTLPIMTLAPLLPALLVLVPTASKTSIGTTVLVWAGIAVLSTTSIGVRRAVTRYRITAQHFELRTGILSRNLRTIPRERVRSVDLTANPVQRLFGLAVVNIGTGEQHSANAALALDAVSRARAEHLQRVLLRQSDDAEQDRADGVISTMRTAWHAYAMLTVSLVLAVWSALLSAFGTFDDVLASWGLLNVVEHLVETYPLWLVITAPVSAGVAIGLLGALAISVERWWNFQLTRESDNTLRVRRGLLTTRVTSLEERRLRGIALSEPLLLRVFGGARLSAVTTGLAEIDSAAEKSALLPPAPHTEVERVGSDVLRRAWPVGSLSRHPWAALRRRCVRAAAATVAVLALVLASTGLGWSGPAIAAVLVPIVLITTGIAAVNTYRNLGHTLTADFLITRAGSAVRRTAVLQRTGIIGWRVRQTWFQRRAGLVTLGATTAAGDGHYRVRDVSTADGWGLAEAATPGLLREFQRTPAEDPAHQ